MSDTPNTRYVPSFGSSLHYYTSSLGTIRYRSRIKETGVLTNHRYLKFSCLFCRSVARYQLIAIVSFANNGRFSGQMVQIIGRFTRHLRGLVLLDRRFTVMLPVETREDLQQHILRGKRNEAALHR